MKLAKKQLFFVSLLLTFCISAAPFAENLYAESLFAKIKDKATNFISTKAEKYTNRDFWVDKASDAIATKVVAKPVKLATSALGVAIGTALGGPVGATLGAYIGNKIATHTCKIIATPVVKNIINDKLDNGGKITISSIYNACKSVDMPELACDTTGSIVGDILGSALGGIAGAAIMACVGGGTILPIIGTITFATLGSKYGEKLGTWLGDKLGRNAYNSTYKIVTGKDRNEGASLNVFKQTLNDVKAVDKKEVAKNTTSSVVGDVIGSAIGTVAGATLSAFTTGGMSSTMAKVGEKWGSKLGSRIGDWVGNKFFDNDKKKKDKATQEKPSIITAGTSITVSDEIPVYSSIAASPEGTNSYYTDAEAAYTAYKIAYEKYSEALNDENSSQEKRDKLMRDYHACYDNYKRIVTGK